MQQERHDEPRGRSEGENARGTHLPPPLRRALVDGHPVGRLPTRGLHQAMRADVESEIRGVHDAQRSQANARWSSQDLVETMSARLVRSFELLRAQAAKMTVTPRPIVKGIDIISQIGFCKFPVFVDL